jgi:hypothetical protein
MNDEKDFIEFKLAEAEEITGRQLSASELATEFAKLGPSDRVHYLMKMKNSDAYVDARTASKRYVYEHMLRETHKKLRDIQR